MLELVDIFFPQFSDKKVWQNFPENYFYTFKTHFSKYFFGK